MPPKPGFATTEFLLLLIGNVALYVAQATGASDAPPQVALGASAIAYAAYALSRAFVKGKFQGGDLAAELQRDLDRALADHPDPDDSPSGQAE